jgi:hypothetical protein
MLPLFAIRCWVVIQHVHHHARHYARHFRHRVAHPIHLVHHVVPHAASAVLVLVCVAVPFSLVTPGPPGNIPPGDIPPGDVWPPVGEAVPPASGEGYSRDIGREADLR